MIVVLCARAVITEKIFRIFQKLIYPLFSCIFDPYSDIGISGFPIKSLESFFRYVDSLTHTVNSLLKTGDKERLFPVHILDLDLITYAKALPLCKKSAYNCFICF